MSLGLGLGVGVECILRLSSQALVQGLLPLSHFQYGDLCCLIAPPLLPSPVG